VLARKNKTNGKTVKIGEMLQFRWGQGGEIQRLLERKTKKMKNKGRRIRKEIARIVIDGGQKEKLNLKKRL